MRHARRHQRRTFLGVAWAAVLSMFAKRAPAQAVEGLRPHCRVVTGVNAAGKSFVASDGHHGLFGITLLDFEEASRYIRALNPNGRYDTYRYPDLASYSQAFAAARLSLEVLPETLAHASGEGVENELAKLSAGAEAGLSTVPPELRDLVRERLEAYLSRARAASWREGYMLDYGPGFWIALSRRSR